jgi:hypothetical protein
MDTGKQVETRLLADAVKAMEPLGLRFRILEQQQTARRRVRTDATLVLRTGGRDIRYVAEVKRTLRPATLGPILHQIRGRAETLLLVTDHVTPPLADELRAQGVEFIDTAGNAFLNQPPLLVFVKGQRRPAQEPGLERGRAFTATGLQVLFALLARPELFGRPYREIAAAAKVAHGTVGWVMAELPGLGYLAKVRGHRRLVNGQRLLDQWTEAYARTLRPRLLLGRFRGGIEALRDPAAGWPEGLLIGGELAAARLTRHLRPGTGTLYAEAIDPSVVVKFKLKADPGGNVDFRRRFWAFTGDEPDLAPTLLVYADLLAIGDARCLETAQLLRDPLLARLV